MINELRLDLACGDLKCEGFKGIDVVPCKGADYVIDLQQFPWDIATESAEEIRCYHYVEHIKHDNVALDLKQILDKSNSFDEFKANVNSLEFLRPKDGLIKFINEVYRILKIGGKLTLIVPFYSSMRAFGDPTHCRYLCDFSFLYFSREWREANGLSHYGIDCDFEMTYSYAITNEMTLKSTEVRNKAFIHDLNVIDDMIIDLIKK